MSDARRNRRRTLVPVVLLVLGTTLFAISSRSLGATPAPPAPTLTRTPSNPTPSTSAHFKYTDAQPSVTFGCVLDGSGYSRCGAAVNYSGLVMGSHTFCVLAVDKVGRTSDPTCFRWSIVGTNSMPFTPSGSARGLLYPGGPSVPVELTIANPNTAPITVTSVTTAVTGTSAAGCRATDFVVVSQLTASLIVPAGATTSLSALQVPVTAWPQLRMLDDGDQGPCRAATVRLGFSGTATG